MNDRPSGATLQTRARSSTGLPANPGCRAGLARQSRPQAPRDQTVGSLPWSPSLRVFPHEGDSLAYTPPTGNQAGPFPGAGGLLQGAGRSPWVTALRLRRHSRREHTVPIPSHTFSHVVRPANPRGSCHHHSHFTMRTLRLIRSPEGLDEPQRCLVQTHKRSSSS